MERLAEHNSRTTSERPAAVLVVDQICVVYSRMIRAITDLSFRVGKGEIVALLGPNGAGKTTTLRAISGFLPGDRAQITQGRIRFRDTDTTGVPPYRLSRMGMAMIPERDKIFASLTVEENLRIGARANPDPKDAIALRDIVLETFPILANRHRQQAGYLSGGERQMLAIASALLSRPAVLLIDELSLGLSPMIVKDLIRDLVRINREEGMTLLLVEQSASVAMAIAQYVYVLNNGRVVKEGFSEEFKSSGRLASSYLGLGGDG